MIKLDAIHKTFTHDGKQHAALSNINLHIRDSEIFGIIGHSGAGKSTLIRTMNLLERPTSGTVTVNKLNLTVMDDESLRHARHNIGMIFQDFNLLNTRTVYENVAFPLEIAGITDKNALEKVINPLLEITELSDKKDRYPHQLSGGQKQRVGIARALANDPKVLLCDESTSALDPRTTQSILKLLQRVNKELGVTIVVITHEMDVVKTICDRIAVLKDGEIVELGSVIEIFTEPKSEITKNFVKSALRQELPQAIRRMLTPSPAPDKCPMLRLVFRGNTASQPLIGNLIKKFHLNVNIVQAHIESIADETLGVMLIELNGDEDNIEKGIKYLQTRQLNIEIIGYVARNT